MARTKSPPTKEFKSIEPVDKDNTNHYINNKEFLKALIAYQQDIVSCEKSGKPKPYVTEYIAMCFLQLSLIHI